MARAMSSLAWCVLSTSPTWCVGCGPMNDFGYVSQVELPQQAAPPQPGVLIRVGGGGERYPIHLSWPAQVGRRGRTRVDIDDTRTTEIRKSGKEGAVQTAHERVTSEGILEVLEVGDDGTMTKGTLALDKLDADLDKKAPVHLRNARVHVERAPIESDAVVTVDERPATAAERKAVDEIVTLKISDLPTDDQALGTNDLIAPGSRWPVRGDLVRRALTEDDLVIPDGAVTGDMSLRGVVDRGGVPCLDITGTLDVQPFEVRSLGQAPLVSARPGALQPVHIEHSALHVVSHLVVPTTPGPRFEDDLTITTELTVATPDGSIVESHGRRASQRAYEPID